MLCGRETGRLMAAGSWLRGFSRSVTHTAAKSWRQCQKHGSKECNEFGRNSVHAANHTHVGAIWFDEFFARSTQVENGQWIAVAKFADRMERSQRVRPRYINWNWDRANWQHWDLQIGGVLSGVMDIMDFRPALWTLASV